MLDPQAMRVFAAIARAGGVRGAAQAVGLPRSTVSRRLAELEVAAKGPLVIRTTRRFALTELGAALLERCYALDMLMESAEVLVAEHAREPSGTLRVTVAPVLGEEILPSLLGTFVRRYPLMSVDARLSIDFVDLRRGDVDVALRAGPLEDASDLFARRLATSISGFWASPSYLAARGTPIEPADLAHHDCIVVGRSLKWTLGAAGRGREQVVEVGGRLRVDSFRVARSLALRGLGIARLARMAAAPHAVAGELVPILEAYWVRTPIFAVRAGGGRPPPAVAAFIEMAKTVVGALDLGDAG